MKTATLVINDTKKFDDAVFQMQTGNTRTNYEGWLQDVIKTLKGIQQYAATTDAISSEEEYTLGDVINLLSTVSVTVKQECSSNPIDDVYYDIIEWVSTTVDEVINTGVSHYYKLDDSFALVLARVDGFEPCDYDYERKDGDNTSLPCLSIRHLDKSNNPDNWVYVRIDDNAYAVADGAYIISHECEIDDVVRWLKQDFDEYVGN